MMTPRTALCALLLAVLTGCVVPDSAMLGTDAAFDEDDFLADHLEPDDLDTNPLVEPEGGILAPAELLVFVDEELAFDVTLSDNATGVLAASMLPEESTWVADELGGSFSWTPHTEDIGDHDLVFLLVDELEPDLVLSQTTVLVAVRTRNSLVEYGF